MAVLRGEQRDAKGTADIMPGNGQVERMNRTLKDATVKRFYYTSHDQLRQQLADFVSATTSADA